MTIQLNILNPDPNQNPKPLYGEPCNGCGICCMQEICPPGLEIFEHIRGHQLKAEQPCPALEYNSQTKRFDCLLAHNLEFAYKAGIGVGCDAVLTVADRRTDKYQQDRDILDY